MSCDAQFVVMTVVKLSTPFWYSFLESFLPCRQHVTALSLFFFCASLNYPCQPHMTFKQPSLNFSLHSCTGQLFFFLNSAVCYIIAHAQLSIDWFKVFMMLWRRFYYGSVKIVKGGCKGRMWFVGRSIKDWS